MGTELMLITGRCAAAIGATPFKLARLATEAKPLMRDQDNTMQQPFLKMPNLHRVINRAHADLLANGAAIAAETGLMPCGPVGWTNGQRGNLCVDLTVYRPRHGAGERYAVTRFFDGQYASVTCMLPEHAKRALLAESRAEFERIGALVGAPHAAGGTDAGNDDPESASIALLAADVDLERRDVRPEAKQLPLF